MNRGFFTVFCCCDLDLDPMTFTHELDSYLLEIYRKWENELSALRLSKVVTQTDRQTDTEIIYHATSRVVKNAIRRVQCLHLAEENCRGTENACSNKTFSVFAW